MMLGREDSMPNVVDGVEVDVEEMPSDDRERARAVARDCLGYRQLALELYQGAISAEQVALMARAVLRYCPEGVPSPLPHLVAASTESTLPAVLADFPDSVPGHVDLELSDGTCEVSDDAPTDGARLSFTSMYDLGAHGPRR